MPFSLIPFLLLIIPVVEIAVFITVGSAIGVWPTIGLIIVTAVLGSIFLRRQGLSTIGTIQREIQAGRLPGKELVSGLMIAIAGVLLLTPGFVTDTLGFLLFVPGVRNAVWNFVKSKVVVVGGQAAGAFGSRSSGPSRRPGQPDVVDLSGEEYRRQPDPSSPWNEKQDGENPNRTLH